MTNHRKGPKLSPSDRDLIAQFLMANSTDGVVHFGKIKAAAASFGVSRRTIQYTWELAKKQMLAGTPVTFNNRKLNGGRAAVQLDTNLMKTIPFSKRGTIRRLAVELKVSKSKVGRWVKSGTIKPHTNAVKPALTEANKLQRLKYSLSYLHLDRTNHTIRYETMHNIIHVDEKWFYMQRISERGYKLAEETDPYRACKSKRFIPKVMFMCAVSRPQYGPEGKVLFDGKIGIFPFTKKVPALRNSVNRQKGTLVTKPIESITKEVIKSCFLNQIIPAIKAKWPESSSKNIVIQQDNAKPHICNEDEDFRAAASSNGFDIQLICQPPNSPDTNVLDLGYFRAIQSLQVETPSSNVDDLVSTVLKSYEDLEISKLNNIFLSLQQCMIEVMKLNDNNNYKLGHMDKAALTRACTLPAALEVDEATVRQGIEHLIEMEQAGGTYDIGGLLADLGYE